MLSFILESHWSARLVKAVWHEWCSLNSDWLGWSRLFLLKCARMFVYVFLKWLWESWQDRNWPQVWRIWIPSGLKKRNDFESIRNVTSVCKDCKHTLGYHWLKVQKALVFSIRTIKATSSSLLYMYECVVNLGYCHGWNGRSRLCV